MPRPMVQGGLDNPIQVWDTRSGKLEGTYLKDSRAWMHEITSSFRYMAACDDQPDAGPFDNDFHLVDLQAKNEVRLPLKGNPNYRFSPQETFVLVSEGTEKGNKIFHLMKTATGKVAKTFQGSVFHTFVPDESLILHEAQNGDERDLCIWSTRLQKVVHTLPKVSGGVTVSPDGRTVAAIMADALIFLDLRTFETRRFRPRTGMGLESTMIFAPDGGTLALFLEKWAFVLQKQGIEFWDVASGKQRHGDFDSLKNWGWDSGNFNDWGSQFCFVAFSPDSTFFALAAQTPDGPRLGVWDVSSATLLWVEEPIDAYLGLAFTADSRFLIADPERNAAEIRYARTGERHRRFEAGYSPHRHLGTPRCEFTKDLHFITIRSEITRQPHILEKLLGDWWPKGKANLQHVQVAETTTGRELARLASDTLEEALLSENGQTLVTKHQVNGKYLVRVWDLPLRPPLLLVIGIPLGLGLMVLLFSRWRARRRRRGEVARLAPVAIKPEQVQ